MWNHGNDPAEEWVGPAWVPRELWRDSGRRGALRFCMESRPTAREPLGWDLQSGCGNSDSRANDRPLAHFGDSKSGDYSTTRGWSAQKVSGSQCNICSWAFFLCSCLNDGLCWRPLVNGCCLSCWVIVLLRVLKKCFPQNPYWLVTEGKIGSYKKFNGKYGFVWL